MSGFFAYFEAPYFVTPLRINGNATESLYRLLKFGAGAHLSVLNCVDGLARVKGRVEVSCVTDSGKDYRDQVVVTPPERTVPSYTITCPAGELITKESNCYGYPVVQCTLPADLCQSVFGGRDESNACTLICIFWGLQLNSRIFPHLFFQLLCHLSVKLQLPMLLWMATHYMIAYLKDRQ